MIPCMFLVRYLLAAFYFNELNGLVSVFGTSVPDGLLVLITAFAFVAAFDALVLGD